MIGKKVMVKMKKKIFLIMLILLETLAVSARVKKTESSFVLAREMERNLSGGFYTLVLNQADQMDRNYPNSRYANQILNYRAECYYFLGMRNLALKTLFECEDNACTNYFYGRIAFDSQDYKKAMQYFSKAFKLAQTEKSSKANTIAYFYAQSLSKLNEYEKSVPVTLKLISDAGYTYENGKAALLLCEGFYELSRQDRVCQLYEKVAPVFESFEFDVQRKIILMSAFSYEKQKNSAKAKELFEMVMKTALSEDGSEEGGAEKEISGNEISEFWLRMAIESFANKDYADCSRCLTVAKEQLVKDSDDFAKINSLMLLYEGALKGKLEGPLSGVKALETDFASVTDYKNDFLSMICVLSYDASDYKRVLQYGKQLEVLVLKEESLSQLNALALYRYSQVLSEKGESAKAASVLSSIHSNELWVLTSQAIAYDKGGTVDLGFLNFEQIYKMYPDSKSAYENYIIEQLKKSNSSFATDKKLLELDEGLFYQGLAYYMDSNWNACISSLNDYLAKAGDLVEDSVATEFKNIPLAYYYLGYAYYQLFNNKASYENFTTASKMLVDEKYEFLKYKAYDFASQCAFAIYNATSEEEKQNWLSATIENLEKAEQTRIPLDQKFEAVSLLSQVYVKNDDYQSAEQLLTKYAAKGSEKSLRCALMVANIFAQQKKISEAEKYYQIASSDQNFVEIAEKASYQNALMYFENEFWEESSQRFYQFRHDYMQSENYGVACYYNALCLARMDNLNLAIILMQDSLNYKLIPSDEFAAMYQLMKLCRQNGDYAKSIMVARKLMKQYPEQSKEENISTQIKEISLLVSGENEKTAKLLNEFMEKSQMSTVEGRRLGYELSKKYLGDAAKQNEGLKLLLELIGMEKQMDLTQEADVLAGSYYLYAQYLREKSEYKTAADAFLNSARVYAGFDSENAAKSMYGAIEAFDTAGKIADSAQIYRSAEKQFSDSLWTQRAYLIVKDYLNLDGGN